MLLAGISGFVVGLVDVADLVISLVLVGIGALMIYFSWRSGVLVSETYIEERGMSGGARRVEWADIDAIRTTEGPSLLPSTTIELVGKGDGENIALASLSWYSFRAHRVPARVAEFKRIATVLMDDP